MQFHVQAGAFQEEGNAKNLLEKIQAINTDQNVNVKRVYNSGLHRLLIGPYNSRLAAEQAASNLRQQINIPTTIVTNQK
jgi:rare lipoprotein A